MLRFNSHLKIDIYSTKYVHFQTSKKEMDVGPIFQHQIMGLLLGYSSMPYVGQLECCQQFFTCHFLDSGNLQNPLLVVVVSFYASTFCLG